MKYLCAEDKDTLRLWMVGLRIAKVNCTISHCKRQQFKKTLPLQYGRQLWENYRILMEDLAHEDLDRFGRSVSLACMPQQQQQTAINPSDNSVGSKVQGLNPVGSLPPPPTPPPLPKEEGFESDCPVGGTIKRKPSTGLMAKIPLTLNTRSIVGDYISTMTSTSGGGGPGETQQHTLTLQRKRSLSGNSSASSSNSSVSSQIYVSSNARPTPPPANSKPPTGSLKRNTTSVKPAPVVEETTVVDYDSLPPPPPELLSGEDHLHIHHNQAPLPPPAPPSPSKFSNRPPPPLKPSQGDNQSTVKKGVSFASELSERLKSRSEPKVPPVDQSTTSRKSVSFAAPAADTHPLPPLSSLPTESSTLPPPPQEEFLSDLQRVMQKKWQVAQKCNADKNTTPAEILGFKFNNNVDQTDGTVEDGESNSSSGGSPAPPPASSHVQQWVSQHYGGPQPPQLLPTAESMPPPPPPVAAQTTRSLHQTPSSPKPPPPQRSTPPPQQQQPSIYSTSSVSSIHSSSNYHNNQQCQQTPPPPGVNQLNTANVSNTMVIYENFQGRKSQLQGNQYASNNKFQYDPVNLRNKKPPPPVPKRADSTHLSAHIVFN
jgi:hypothetical protein